MNKSRSPDAPPWEALGPEVANALRPALPGLVDEVMSAVHAAVPEYEEPRLDETVRAGVRQGLEGFLELVASGDEAQIPGREVYINFGRAEARAGRSLEALLAAYRAGAQVAWRGLADAGDRAGLEPRALYTLAEAVFAYIDEISAASAEGVAEEQFAAAGRQRERRLRLLELLLRDPPADPAEVEEAARAADWELAPVLAALAFEGANPDDLARRLTAPALVGELDGVSWALVTDPDGPATRAELEAGLRGAPAALGPTVPWHEAARSAERAALALPLASDPGAGSAALVIAGERLLDLLLVRDPALATEIAERALAPLEQLPATTRDRLRETLQAWLDAHGHARTAAELLHVHVQTLRYRLAQLQDVFGDAVLDDPDGRLELALALRIRSGGNRRA
ncbi:MAG: PucR family transcriptional regulator [Thermoleophilaceae bacterium]